MLRAVPVETGFAQPRPRRDDDGVALRIRRTFVEDDEVLWLQRRDTLGVNF